MTVLSALTLCAIVFAAPLAGLAIIFKQIDRRALRPAQSRPFTSTRAALRGERT